MHIFHTATVFGAGGDNIDSCGVNAAVSENVGKLGNILLNAVKHTGEQVAEVVRKHLLRVDLCLDAQSFHFPPDIRAADWFAGAGYKNHSTLNILLRSIAEQFFSQLPDNKNRSCLALAVHHRLTAFGRLQFTDPDACTANRLQDEIQPFVVPVLRRPAKSLKALCERQRFPADFFSGQ